MQSIYYIAVSNYYTPEIVILSGEFDDFTDAVEYFELLLQKLNRTGNGHNRTSIVEAYIFENIQLRVLREEKYSEIKTVTLAEALLAIDQDLSFLLDFLRETSEAENDYIESLRPLGIAS
uniref:hypothetical protein n=1 Tax=Algoriphagus sp. TaxID=1872435 RepID=UPI002585ABC5|nr:hypothetical protein [Algoriphagus sp.]